MATTPPKRPAPKLQSSVIRWLLDSDPSIRWQVMRDLIGAPADEVAAERAKVATEGWGAWLLALQGADGSWLARRLTRGGTPQCMCCRCCENWVLILRSMRRVGQWT